MLNKNIYTYVYSPILRAFSNRKTGFMLEGEMEIKTRQRRREGGESGQSECQVNSFSISCSAAAANFVRLSSQSSEFKSKFYSNAP